MTISLVTICKNHLETQGKGNITRLFCYNISQIKPLWKRRKDHRLKIWQFGYLVKSLDSFQLNSTKLSEGVVHVLHIILFQKISKASATDLRHQCLLNEWNMYHVYYMPDRLLDAKYTGLRNREENFLPSF